MTDTMELFCKHCGEVKPPDEMRKDKSYASGYRPQCLDCKSKAEGYSRRRKSKPKSKSKSKSKKAAPKAKAVSKPTVDKKKTVEEKPLLPDGMKLKPKPEKKKTPAEERVYPCDKCERQDIPFEEMCKDKRKFMGVANVCKECRRKREAELKQTGKSKRQPRPKVAEVKALTSYGDEWEYCWKCNNPARPGVLSQPPSAIAAGFPDGVRLCHKCLSYASTRIDHVQLERRRLGVPENATRKQLESAARVAALKELAHTHEEEYRKSFRRYMVALGAESEKAWITL